MIKLPDCFIKNCQAIFFKADKNLQSIKMFGQLLYYLFSTVTFHSLDDQSKRI